MNDNPQIDFAKLTILDDQGTPYKFVVDLLEEVFGLRAHDGQRTRNCRPGVL